MDRPSISHIFAHYITHSCYIIIPYFNNCARSCKPITVNHQNKEIDFSVWASHFGRLKKDRKRGRGGKQNGGEQEGKTRAGLSLSHGKVYQMTTTVLLSKAREIQVCNNPCAEHWYGVLSTCCSHCSKAGHCLTQDWASASQTIALPAALSTRHAPVVFHRGFQAPSSHHCMQTLTYMREVTTDTLWQTSWCHLFDPDTKVKYSSNWSHCFNDTMLRKPRKSMNLSTQLIN